MLINGKRISDATVYIFECVIFVCLIIYVIFLCVFFLQNINWCEVITEDGLEGRSRPWSKAEQKREKVTK